MTLTTWKSSNENIRKCIEPSKPEKDDNIAQDVASCELSPSSLAFWDYANAIWPCITDKSEHFGEFVDGTTCKISSVEAADGKPAMAQPVAWLNFSPPPYCLNPTIAEVVEGGEKCC